MIGVPRPSHSVVHEASGRHRSPGALTVLKLLAFQEEISVSVTGVELKTHHSFSLAGLRFLTLRYEIERIAPSRA